MEGRVRKYRHQHQQLSPERAVIWKERSPKSLQRQSEPEMPQKSGKVPVVYYLCKNRQLEHPHFIEVLPSSSEGLFLRDVIEKLNVLRGSGMASMYSWSCKRSYKNGFVWHDLCEDDLILPATGNEYVLKGSELIKESNSGRFVPDENLQNLKQLPQPPSARSQDESSSSTSISERDTKTSQNDDMSSDVSPESRCAKSTPSNDASTQTEENPKDNKPRETCTRGVSTDDVASEIQPDPSPPCSSSTYSVKTETLESLIKADASKYNSFRRLQESQTPVNSKLKATDMLMQLLSCGSISVKDHSFGLIPSYKPRFSDSKFPSPLFSTSVMLGEFDSYSDNSRLTSMRLEDKDYFSGSLKRSSSFNADRINDDNHDLETEEPATLTKCIPKSLKSSISKHSKSEPTRSPVHEGPRISSRSGPGSRIVSPAPSNCSSKRITSPCSSKKHSGRLDSAIKTEERLASGARVIIHSGS